MRHPKLSCWIWPPNNASYCTSRNLSAFTSEELDALCAVSNRNLNKQPSVLEQSWRVWLIVLTIEKSNWITDFMQQCYFGLLIPKGWMCLSKVKGGTKRQDAGASIDTCIIQILISKEYWCYEFIKFMWLASNSAGMDHLCLEYHLITPAPAKNTWSMTV